ncbi:AAA family ATPase [Cytobacillus sp. Hz8]|uniref:AAA family ATPase n=1 Tax=Cytobacillus sp. Hz8 TaxID=3347168 RepID=UPI0035DCA2E2
MIQQEFHRQEIEHSIHIWEEEIKEKGFIHDETSILKVIRLINEQSDAKEMSTLLTLAALSRMGKMKKKDSLIHVWMEQALRLDSKNERASQFLAQFQWEKKKDLFQELEFPILRETDQGPAKKKIAKDIILICQQFLEAVEEEYDELEHGADSAKAFHEEKLALKYQNLLGLINAAIEQVSVVLKTATDYHDSISGMFYNTTYFQNLKSDIAKIKELKAQWESDFAVDQEKESNITLALAELDQMIGLADVKARVHRHYQYLKYQNKRKSLGYKMKDELSLHMVLTGNPGTGKTTLARLFAKIYFELGVLPREDVIEVDRSQLVGSFVGQTEENVRAAVSKALGGVLFIDEAYSLKREGQSGNDYGQAAIDTLVSLMTGEEFGGKFACILAGYPEEMRQFLDANPGLRSRFPQSNFIQLADYNTNELIEIANQMALENDYFLTDDATIELKTRLEKERVDDTFGNARTVKNIILDAIFQKGAKENHHLLDYTILEREDFLLPFLEDSRIYSSSLHDLIGLNEVKEEVETLLSFVKMQQLRREKGLPVVPVQLHSVFTGNPGTGKTTVAKIYAEQLKEYGILKRGHLLVVSRADLVAGYVGQSAIKTKKKIREALGGVLFIDEAYSLFNHSSSDFGKEVVDTLVDEMTKHNENLVVILAGYPNEMERLLESNPGLKSRFKKFFYFQDYSPEELLEIMVKYAVKFQYTLNDEAKSYILERLTQIKLSGNGRFATNVIDEAIQIQAVRVLQNDLPLEMEETANMIVKEDMIMAINKRRKGE